MFPTSMSRRCSASDVALLIAMMAAADATGHIHFWDAAPLRGDEDPNLRQTLLFPGPVWAMSIAAKAESLAKENKSPKKSPGEALSQK